jgi:hypothetical protein
MGATGLRIWFWFDWFDLVWLTDWLAGWQIDYYLIIACCCFDLHFVPLCPIHDLYYVGVCVCVCASMSIAMRRTSGLSAHVRSFDKYSLEINQSMDDDWMDGRIGGWTNQYTNGQPTNHQSINPSTPN